jgi:DNA-binding NtrC family response regulator
MPVTGGPARILIVDDEAAVRSFISRVLTGPRYTTVCAAGGPEALEIIETAGAIDLLVTDLVMPNMRGDELARHVRTKTPSAKVLYVTGHRDQLFEESARRWDDEAFLDKPFTMHGLLEAVSLVLFDELETIEPDQAARGPSKPAANQSLRVLLVEDVEDDARLIQRELERSRFSVQCDRVDTAETLTNALERETWNLIITDHAMPRLNAMTVLKIVRDHGLTVPCVLVSGTASAETAAAAMKIGADDFVSKENLRALGPSVTRALDDADKRRARARMSRLRLQGGQEFDVLEWGSGAAVLTGLVGLAPGRDHECLLLADGKATRVRIRVIRSDVSTLSAGHIVYRTIATTILGAP